MLKRRTLIQAAFALVFIGGLAGFSAFAHWYKAWMDEFGPAWRAMDWPLADDGAPPGRSWRNQGLEVHARVRRGHLADCSKGIGSDADVDRATGIARFDARFAPRAASAPIAVTDLDGRARLYRRTGAAPADAWAIAVTLECDLVTFVVLGAVADPAVRKQAHQFIESNALQVWLNKILEER